LVLFLDASNFQLPVSNGGLHALFFCPGRIIFCEWRCRPSSVSGIHATFFAHLRVPFCWGYSFSSQTRRPLSLHPRVYRLEAPSLVVYNLKALLLPASFSLPLIDLLTTFGFCVCFGFPSLFVLGVGIPFAFFALDGLPVFGPRPQQAGHVVAVGHHRFPP